MKNTKGLMQKRARKIMESFEKFHRNYLKISFKLRIYIYKKKIEI